MTRAFYGYTTPHVIDVAWILALLALAAVTVFPHDRRGTRPLGVGIALIVLALGIWRMIHAGEWWKIVVLVAIVAVWIAVDQLRGSRSHQQ